MQRGNDINRCPRVALFRCQISGGVGRLRRVQQFGALHMPTGARQRDRQCQHQREVIVRCDAVKALETATEAAMDERMLAIGPLKGGNGSHRRATGVHAVAGLRIHMARVQAKRTMVAVLATLRQRTHQLSAVCAAKHLVRRIAPLLARRGCGFIVSGIVETRR